MHFQFAEYHVVKGQGRWWENLSPPDTESLRGLIRPSIEHDKYAGWGWVALADDGTYRRGWCPTREAAVAQIEREVAYKDSLKR